jgi:hypothetical protein
MGAYFPAGNGYRRFGDGRAAAEAEEASAIFILHHRLSKVRETLAALAGSAVDGEARELARRSLDAEAAALASALLYQQPGSWRDALLLVHHLNEALTACDPPAGPAAVAAEALFDFLAAHVDEDHEPLGEAFQQATVRALRSNRHRLGHFDP